MPPPSSKSPAVGARHGPAAAHGSVLTILGSTRRRATTIETSGPTGPTHTRDPAIAMRGTTQATAGIGDEEWRRAVKSLHPLGSGMVPACTLAGFWGFLNWSRAPL